MRKIANRYSLLRKLGEGSIGEVYLAEDSREGKEVCLKLLKTEFSAFETDLSAEFALLTKLHHPGLISVYDYGIDPRAGRFFTMEYISGGDLSGAIPLKPEEFFDAAESLCSALDYIHNRGIIHGDLKPSNILRYSDRNYRIADFGLSSIQKSESGLTSSGTAAFVAPEVLKKESVSNGSDIYSLGLLLYEMISGRPLYEGTAGEIIGRKLSGGLPLFTIPREYGGSEMESILQKMLSGSPDRRFKSAGEAADRIGELRTIAGRPRQQEISIPETGEFTGRLSEIRLFETCFESYGSDGCLLFIGGESGVGKSRLLDEFKIRTQMAGARFYKTACREGILRPFSPILKILGYLFSELDPNMTLFSSYGPDLKKLFPEKYKDLAIDLWEPSEADIRSGRRRLFDNLLRYLDDLSKSHRLILTFEDLHWADSDTLEFLEYFHSNTAAARNTLIICTARTLSDDKIPSFLTSDDSRRAVLKPIDRELWLPYLYGFLGKSDFPASFTDRLYEETGGNFLFSEELIKELASQRLLVRRAGTWSIVEGWEEKIGIPDGVTPLINRRMDKLDHDQKRLVGTAAALGRSFYDEELFELAGIPAQTVLIEELIAKGIFKRAIFGLDEKVYFIHLQMKRSAEESIPPDENRQMHNRIARYYEKRGEDEEFLGRHYLLGGELEKGFDYLVAAARKAERLFAYKQVSDLYKTALRGVTELPNSPELNEKLFIVQLGAGKALDYISPPEASGYLADAAALAREVLGDNALAADALIAAGNNSLHLGENDTAIKYLNEGLALSGESGQEKLQGEAYVGLGFVYDKTGKLDEAGESYLKALELFAGIDFPEGSCRVLNYLGITRKRRGDLVGAEDFYRRALSICKEREFKWSAMNLYGNLGNLYSTKGDFKKAEEHYRLSLEISRQISDRRIESVNLLNTGHVLNQMGEIESAEKMFFEAIEKQRALGDKSSEAITLNNLGFLYFKKGELKNSLEYYQKGLELSRKIDQPRIELANLIGIVEDRAAIADYSSDLISTSEKAMKLAEEIDDIEQLAAIMTIHAEILRELGYKSQAKDILERYLGLSSDLGEPRQRIKALLLAGYQCPDIDRDRMDIDNRIDRILESDPALVCIVTRFKAENVLAGDNQGRGPEIWIARINDAIRKAGDACLYSEGIRLMAIKTRFLRLIGETLEASREEDRLNAELDRFTSGLDEELKSKFRGYLRIAEVVDEEKQEDIIMGSANREERLEVLFRVARTINTIRESDPLLNKIMDLAIETLMAERGFIMLYTPENDSVQAPRTLEPVAARNLEREDILGEKTISRSSAMEVAESGKPLLLSRTDDEISGRQSVVDFRISSILCVPLAVKGRILGIVYIDSRSGTVFNDDDLEFLTSFADLAAIAIENTRLTEKLEEKTVYLQKQIESRWDFGNIVGRSSPMQRVFRMAESISDTNVNVVISGESGTGKELLAKAIHFASKRKNGRFQPVDCGAVTETLLESELFGYVKGAFTGADSDKPGLFEVAENGTIFLDEISNTSANFQAKLLRVLQESEIRRVGDTRSRKINVRVIAATNKNLEDEVKTGNFREDLYYRLNVVNIIIPPLKDRKEDISLLAGYFLEKICDKMSIPRKVFSAEAINSMSLYFWPGNVRQLENICERAVIFSKGETIGPEYLPPEIKLARYPETGESANSVPSTKSELKTAKAELDKMFIIGLLQSTNGNIMKAAAISGMDRSQLHHMINKFSLDSASYKKKA